MSIANTAPSSRPSWKQRFDEARDECDRKILLLEQNLNGISTMTMLRGAITPKEVHAMRLDLHLAQRKRNSFSLVSVLPIEILSNIFMLAIDASLNFAWTRDTERLSHVCYHWRKVMIGCPAIWCRIPCRRLDQTLLWITRSKDHTLDINLPDHARCQEGLVALIVAQIPRASSLRLCINQEVEKIAHEVLRAAAPALERLQLFGGGGTQISTTGLAGLFSGVTPRLRHLELIGVLMSWDSPVLSNLTTLSLMHLPSPPEPGRQLRISVTQLVCILHRCPTLRELILRDVFDTFAVESIVHPTDIDGLPLPSLTYLKLRDRAYQCSTLLSSISTPCATNVHADCIGSPDSPGYFRFIAALALSLRGNPHTSRFIHLTVSADAQFRADFSMFPRRTPNRQIKRLWEAAEDPALRFAYELPSDAACGAEWLVALVATLPLSHLLELHVDDGEDGSGMISLGADQWSRLHDCCPRLRLLAISGELADSFFSALAAIDDPTRQDGSTVHFPSLSQLIISGHFTICQLSVETIKICLLDRRRRGAALETLDLVECDDICMRALRELQSIVAYVAGYGTGYGRSTSGEDVKCYCLQCAGQQDENQSYGDN